MISITRSLQELDSLESERLRRKSMECYLAAIQLMVNHAVPGPVDDLRDYREALARIYRELFDDSSERALESSRAELAEEVAAYAAKVTSHYEDIEREIKQILNLLTEATGALTERSARYTGEFQGFAIQLEQTSKSDDLRQIRLQLSGQVEKLRFCAESFREENAAVLRPIQEEMKAFEKRLENAERLASTDSLTEVFNRREGEKSIQRRIRAGRPFCLLIIDLNRFKWINDRYGHQAGDQVLKLVGRKLQEQVRPSDTVCRWGGDEFLIILDCGLKDAMIRSRQIGDQIWGRHTVSIPGRHMDVSVSACCGVALHAPGESLEQVFERADAMLYRIKGRRAN